MGDYLKTVVFIDGENLYYNLKSFEFRQEYEKPFHLLPQYVNWTKFFDALLHKLNEGSDFKHVLQRIYWYVVDRVSPYREPSPEKLKRAVQECKKKGKLTSLDVADEEEEVKHLAKKWHDDLAETIRQRRDALHTAIQTHTDFLQFRYVGKLALDPFKVRRFESVESSYLYEGAIHSEKGIDVALAVDMVTLASDYDVAVLVSGDADFVPAVLEVKRRLKWVYQFSLAKGIPPRIYYLSADLKTYVDRFIYVDELEFLRDLLAYDRIHEDVKPLIKARRKELFKRTDTNNHH